MWLRLGLPLRLRMPKHLRLRFKSRILMDVNLQLRLRLGLKLRLGLRMGRFPLLCLALRGLRLDIICSSPIEIGSKTRRHWYTFPCWRCVCSCSKSSHSDKHYWSSLVPCTRALFWYFQKLAVFTVMAENMIVYSSFWTLNHVRNGCKEPIPSYQIHAIV